MSNSDSILSKDKAIFIPELSILILLKTYFLSLSIFVKLNPEKALKKLMEIHYRS
jgi:hypothetical protein